MNPTLFLCGPCAATPNRFPFRRVFGGAYFSGAVAETIKLLKFHGRVRAVHPLASLMSECIKRTGEPAEYQFVVPVPLHRVRERARGFNQSRLLANALMHIFPNAVMNESLRRLRPTKTQSLLRDRTERTRNVRNAFGITGDTSCWKNATVLLIDDVVTTYGTVAECALVLKRVGVAHVDILCAALGVAP